MRNLFMKFNPGTLVIYTVVLLLTYLTLLPSVQAKVIHKERSLYRNILVEDKAGLRCLRFNVKSKKSNQSCFALDEPERLVFNYTKLMFSGLLLQPNPKRILIIGLGGGTMSNTLHQLFPSSEIDNVELDEAVIKVARDYFSFFENDQVRSIAKDGRIFIKRAALKKQQYDWIILDAFNGDYIPEHLLTKEFLEEAKSLLSPQGILSANTFSNSKLYNYESATYSKVFGEFYSVNNRSNENRIIVASNQPLPAKTSLLNKAHALSSILLPFGVDMVRVHSSISTEQDWPMNTPILTDQFAPANLLNTN